MLDEEDVRQRKRYSVKKCALQEITEDARDPALKLCKFTRNKVTNPAVTEDQQICWMRS